ncbi:hypothetical protein YPPY54_1861, partial [Yersinia pestis PY-54]
MGQNERLFLYNLVLPEPETLKYSPGYLVHEY